MTTKIKNSAVYFITTTNRILILKEKRSGKWMVPGGIIEKRETPWISLNREFYEETGFKIDKSKIQEISTYIYHNHTKIYVIYSTQRFNMSRFKKNNEVSEMAFMKMDDFINNKHYSKKLKNYVVNSFLYGYNNKLFV